jgi:transcriptional regulator with XRE-family HTH domain
MNEPLNPAQVRAARALLAWSQQDLARNAQVGASTVADFERGQRTPVPNNADAMRSALEDAGVKFMAGGAVLTESLPSPEKLTSGSPIRWIEASDHSEWADRRDCQTAYRNS